MVTADAPPARDGAVRGGPAWVRFLVGFAVLWTVLAGAAQLDPTAAWGVAVLAAVLAVGVVVERVLHGHRARAAPPRVRAPDDPRSLARGGRVRRWSCSSTRSPPR